MAYRLSKIYTTTELMDVHVLQALLESYAIPAYLWEGNGAVMDSSKPLDDLGIKLFVDASRIKEVENIFRDRFGATTEPPYTGAFSVFAGSKGPNPGFILDPRDKETITWDAGFYDPLASMEAQEPAKPARECRFCNAAVEADSQFCDQCGERLD